MNFMAGRTILNGYGHSFYAEHATAFLIRDALRHDARRRNSASNSRKIREKLSRRNRQRLRQLHDVLKAHIPLASLYPADVVAMQTSPFRQFLLRVAPLVAELPQRRAKSRLNRTRGHPSMLEW